MPAAEQPLPRNVDTFRRSVTRYFKNYWCFKGFASREEFWWVQLYLLMVSSALTMVGVLAGESVSNVLSKFCFAAFIVPSLSLSWRRLHDAGFAGPWFLINAVPFVGWLGFIVMTLLPTDRTKQKKKWSEPADI